MICEIIINGSQFWSIKSCSIPWINTETGLFGVVNSCGHLCIGCRSLQWVFELASSRMMSVFAFAFLPCACLWPGSYKGISDILSTLSSLDNYSGFPLKLPWVTFRDLSPQSYCSSEAYKASYSVLAHLLVAFFSLFKSPLSSDGAGSWNKLNDTRPADQQS